MIRKNFLDAETRQNLIVIARDGTTEHRLARRANAIVLLDDGWSCKRIAEAFLLDDDTIRTWYKSYQQNGINGLLFFGHEGSACRLNTAQQNDLKAWITKELPRTARQIGAWIEHNFNLTYQARSSLIALLHRLGMEHLKPQIISRKLDSEKQKNFIAQYDALCNRVADSDEEIMLFADAVHPTHTVRTVGCWAPKGTDLAVEQSSGRERINIHGAIDLASGHTFMIEASSVNAESTIALFNAIETRYASKKKIHLFVDHAKYHHAKIVQEWLKRPCCRVELHFIPTYCPHLNPIERLWGLMHKHVTHNRCYAKFSDFCGYVLNFLRNEVPRNWRIYCDSVTDNFRITNPADFRVLN